jgi:hypothetical protein
MGVNNVLKESLQEFATGRLAALWSIVGAAVGVVLTSLWTNERTRPWLIVAGAVISLLILLLVLSQQRAKRQSAFWKARVEEMNRYDPWVRAMKHLLWDETEGDSIVRIWRENGVWSCTVGNGPDLGGKDNTEDGRRLRWAAEELCNEGLLLRRSDSTLDDERYELTRKGHQKKLRDEIMDADAERPRGDHPGS